MVDIDHTGSDLDEFPSEEAASSVPALVPAPAATRASGAGPSLPFDLEALSRRRPSAAAHDAAVDVTTALGSETAPASTVARSSGNEPAPDVSIGPGLSLAELIENSVQMDWPEAVAIARRICRAIGKHPAAGTHEFLLDPRHIELTERGDVHVLPGAPGGDPFVRQVGRILRALLEGTNAPAQLRLVASQAAFELPGFASVQELSAVLEGFEQAPEAEVIQTAFRRGRELKFSVRHAALARPISMLADAVHVEASGAPRVERIGQAATLRRGSSARQARRRRQGILVAVSLVLVTVLAYLSTRWIGVSGPVPSSSASTSTPSGSVSGRAPGPRSRPSLSNQPAPASESTLPGPRASRTTAAATVARAPDGRDAPVSVSPVEVVRPTSASARPVPENMSAVIPRSEPARARGAGPLAGVIVPVPAEGAGSAAGAPDRAALDPATRTVEFDTLLIADPFYRLPPSRATPEALAALRDSRRVLLGPIARREYDKAAQMLESGDADRALVEGNRILQMLNDPDIGTAPAGLRESVEHLIARATAGRRREAEQVYSAADASVVPPVAIGRQLPLSGPFGVAKGLVGTLEMVIGQTGEVETIRLHTPLNRFHERMIVSAAKAWRYRPALKGGQPVRYRVISTITLPES